MRIFKVLKRSSENGFKGISGYRFSDDLFQRFEGRLKRPS
ncbi:hypothetical protein NEISICOT_02149 [Neisseria sicca ATCC 29256]|uniref:Uncharacterized protein n=2 Tax=Neisseria TaxID=482 RepID=A0AA36XK51_9NEIS|nr:hypothetical protein NEISICOT_02149 [Neisseria sicca ATCC 29256]EGQ76564.1 hypothetical protein HMPREF9418_1815 [Neisseria macacae ATCC 33926]